MRYPSGLYVEFELEINCLAVFFHKKRDPGWRISYTYVSVMYSHDLIRGIAVAETVCHVYKKNCKITGVDKKKEYYFRKGRKNIFKDLRKQE